MLFIMKHYFSLFFVTLLLAAVTGLSSCTGGGNETGTVSLTIRADHWQRLNLYAWFDDGIQPLGNWPGKALTADTKGNYTFTFPKEVTDVNIVLNNCDADGGEQTPDLLHLTGKRTITVHENNECEIK